MAENTEAEKRPTDEQLQAIEDNDEGCPSDWRPENA